MEKWASEDIEAFERVKALRWRASKTYKPAFAHEYTIFTWLPVQEQQEVKRLLLGLFQQYGYAGWFGDDEQTYLDAPDGFTYWLMVKPVEEEVMAPDTVVLNREPTCKRDRRKKGWKSYFATLDLDCGG